MYYIITSILWCYCLIILYVCVKIERIIIILLSFDWIKKYLGSFYVLPSMKNSIALLYFYPIKIAKMMFMVLVTKNPKLGPTRPGPIYTKVRSTRSDPINFKLRSDPTQSECNRQEISPILSDPKFGPDRADSARTDL